jgi:Uma2 family endonuclease
MTPNTLGITIAEYLAMEADSAIRHEYVDGERYPMSDAARAHQILLGNLYFHVRRGAVPPCQVFTGGVLVGVEEYKSFYYPDIVVCCDGSDPRQQYMTTPCALIEILSPSTVDIDQREKRVAYETLKSLKEYVVVHQDRVRVDAYREDPWLEISNDLADVLELTSIGLKLPLSEIYAGLELPCLPIRIHGEELELEPPS